MQILSQKEKDLQLLSSREYLLFWIGIIVGAKVTEVDARFEVLGRRILRSTVRIAPSLRSTFSTALQVNDPFRRRAINGRVVAAHGSVHAHGLWVSSTVKEAQLHTTVASAKHESDVQ